MTSQQSALFELEPPPEPERPALLVQRVLIQSPNGERRFEVEATTEALGSWTRRGWKIIQVLEEYAST